MTLQLTAEPARRRSATSRYRGNQRVNTTTILNSLAFKPGDLYRQSTLLESQRNLYESNLFRLAAIDVPIQYDTVKNVNIDVTEAPLHEARVGPGLNNVDFLQFQAHYTSYNLFGGARRLDIDGTVGNLLASSLQGRGVFRNVAQDVAAADSNRRRRISSRRTRRASTSSSRRSCSGRPMPRASARSRTGRSTPACSSIAGTAARRRSRTPLPFARRSASTTATRSTASTRATSTSA